MSYLISSVGLLLIAAIPCAATVLHSIDFETANDGLYSLDGAVITDKPGSALDGSRSLLADFTSSTEEWNEFLTTAPEVKFEQGRRYHVSFDYRIVDPGSAETRFYSLLRSPSGDIYGNFWLWNRESGARGTIHRMFRPGEKDDWALIIGVRHNGSILVDNVTISICDEEAPGMGLPIKPGDTDLLDIKTELDRLREAEKTIEPLTDALVVWCNEGAGSKITDAREGFARELEPDYVDWNLCGPLAKDFGVRSSSGGPEYQEFYKAESAGVWDDRYRMFGSSGFAVSLDGTFIRDETWGEGGYFTCHNGPNWHKWFIEQLLVQNQRQMGMCQDNIGCAPFYKGQGCFCEHCLDGFRRHLADRYSESELKAFGIESIETFSYVDRVTRYGLVDNSALRDPVTREYIRFQFCSQLEAWTDVVKAIKEDSRERGFPVACLGNQFGASGMWPYAVAIGAYCDVIEIEEVTDAADRIPNTSIFYRMGRAGAHESKPVWIRGPVYDPSKTRTPQMSPLFWQAHFAEALANGGVRDISFGMNSPWTGDPTTLDYIDSPDLHQVWRDYSRLCRENRAVFTNRKSAAGVAVVYSLPTTMFRRFYPLSIDDNGRFDIVTQTSKWLDENAIGHDCVVFGHPDMFPTAMAQLQGYKAIVLPSADALSDAQASFLRDYVARGGLVLKAGDIGIYDENLNLRSKPALEGISLMDLRESPRPALLKLRERFGVKIEAPESVTANLWLSAGGQSLDLHLVNYSADLVEGKWEFRGTVDANIRLPEGFEFDTVRMLEFDGTRRDLDFSREDNKVRVKVPLEGAYAVVSLANGKALDAANAAAAKRRELDREAVRKLAVEKDLY